MLGMEQGNRRWIIRDASGQIDGPFTTEKVLYKIGRGEFLGDEHIARYPSGKWIPISQDPQFYDKLLEVISADDRPGNESTRVLEFTRPQENTEHKPINRAEPVKSPPPPADETPGEKKRSKRREAEPEDIELIDTRPELVRALMPKIKWPILVVAAGLIGLSSLLLVSKPKTEDRIHLIAPQKGIAQLPAESVRPRVHQGVGSFLKDTLDGYVNAQNDFVHVVERSQSNAEVMALLCMTYLQLWPFAYQDSADTKVISQMVQSSSQVDPGGTHSAACRTVDLVVRSRYQEAKSMVEAVLDARANDASPPIIFYFLKGYLLAETGEHGPAIGYLQSAEQLWPQWILPYVVEAQAYQKLERYGDAGNQYRRVLKANPAHSIARIELGLIEYKHFNHMDIGEQYLKQGTGRDDAPKAVLSRGYMGLAEISLRRGDQNRALSYAQKSFSLNSSNVAAKNMIVQIGGVEKLKSTKVKGQQLLFEGDQFFREGDCHAAQAHYKAAFEEDQKNARAAMKAAQCLWTMSFSTEAIEWLNRAIRADPKLVEAYVLLADYQAQRFNFLAAARVLETARRENPKSHEVYRGFALVELQRNNAKGALGFGKQALKLYENDVETQILMAKASLSLRDQKMAYNYAAKAVDLDVNNRRAQIVYAESLAGIQGVDVGVDYFLKLVNNYPLVTEYRLALGRMLAADERYGQATEIFRQIIKLDEKPKEAYIELAKVLKAEGQMREALDLLLKAAVLDPADAEPLYIAGAIYLDLKKAPEASVQFQRVLTINKLYPLVQYQLGRAAMLMNDPRTALNYAEAEKRANPNLADAYLLAAEAHTTMGQFSACAGEYQKAIKLRPQSAQIYVRVSRCYRQAGNLNIAADMLKVAATKESGLAEIYKEQGAIFETKGEIAQAIEAYNQYFTLDPEAPDRTQIEARISALQRGQRP
ncbi:MAG TPA: tetratricopeptide repeat protein [Bdellovibrionales bacterium]|nr:tetratricopeptide repeat protein [Bdellovibrionales bacterium]